MQGLPIRTDIVALSFKVYRLYAKIFTLLVVSALALAIVYPNIQEQYPESISSGYGLEEAKVAVSKGDTLSSILGSYSLLEQEVNQIIDVTASVYDLRKLQIGQVLRLHYSMTDGQKILQSMSLKLDNSRSIEITRAEQEFKLQEVLIPLQKKLVRLSANIDSSIFGAAKKAGIPEKAVLEAINAYSYSVDFQRDIQPNDKFNVVMETYTTEDGKFSHHGKVMFSSLNLSGVEHKIYRYTMADGTEDFIDNEYTSARRSFLKTPVPVARISSKFGMRKHPILGFSKMHKGIDFAAPIGTPIYAAGDGTIEEIGWKGNYGRYIRIKHGNSMSTAYAHIKSFGNGIKRGSAIKQGQVIAYVGTTGNSTGAHLHYEVLKGGKQINPLSIKSIPAKKLVGAELAKFKTHQRNIDQMAG